MQMTALLSAKQKRKPRLDFRQLIVAMAMAAMVFPAVQLRAERVATVSGKFSYVLSSNENITIKEAKLKSIDMAKAEAIKAEFGTLVASDFISTEQGSNDQTQSFYVLDAASSVKGEWLEDLETPRVTMECIGDDLFFHAEVKGKAREIVRAKTHLDWTVSKGAGDSRVESDQFKSGERIYLTFRAPINGYVAAYLITGDEETSCLLPYRGDNRGRVSVIGGRQYTFFDKTADPTATHYKLSTSQPQEFNQLVVIFSPNPFTKCLDFGKDPKRPNVLSRKDFANWLLENQRLDTEMVVARKWLTIEN